MSATKVSSQLKTDLETLALMKGATVPEIVEGIKKQIVADGANLAIVADFFRQMDEVAQLHIN